MPNDLTRTSSTSALAALERKLLDRCDPEVAARAIKQILALFPGQRDRDPEAEEIYVTGLAAVLSEWPGWVVSQAAHPTKGLAGKFTFRPSPSEIKRWCEQVTRPVREQVRDERIMGEMVRKRSARAEPTDADRKAVSDMQAAFYRDVEAKEMEEREVEVEQRKAFMRRSQCEPGAAIKRQMEANREQTLRRTG